MPLSDPTSRRRHRPFIRGLAAVAAASLATLAVAQQVAVPGVDVPASDQEQRLPPANLDRAKAAFDQARPRLAALRQQIDRTEKQAGAPAAGRTKAVADYRRILEDLRPVVGRLAAIASLDQQPLANRLIDEYAGWQTEFATVANVGNVGQFQIATGRHWTELTADSAGWQQEEAELTWPQVLDKPDDPATHSLGLPKTAAFAKAATTYVHDVRQMDAYPSYSEVREVRTDLGRAQDVRREAFAKLAAAADAVISGASTDTLDQAKRDRLDAFVEKDVRSALTGYDRAGETITRGRMVVHAFDRQALGEEKANAQFKERLTANADESWPDLRARYDVETLQQPTLAQRGQVVAFDGVRNGLGKTIRANGYDLAFEANGYPVVARLSPDLKKQVEATMTSVGEKAAPADATYDLVGVVTGLTRVQAERSAASPGAARNATQPSADNPNAKIEVGGAATRPTRLVNSEAVVIDVVALHVGPVAYGVEVPTTQPTRGR